MSLQTFIATPRYTGKTTAAHALTDKLQATYIPCKMSYASTPRGCIGPFVVDELSRQSTDLQQWVLHNLLRYDFYLFCDSADVKSIHPPLQRFLANHYPEAFL